MTEPTIANPCPVGCGRQRRRGHLTCGPCWREIPRHLQTNVYATWRSWSRNLGDAELMEAYREASDIAIGSIR